MEGANAHGHVTKNFQKRLLGRCLHVNAQACWFDVRLTHCFVNFDAFLKHELVSSFIFLLHLTVNNRITKHTMIHFHLDRNDIRLLISSFLITNFTIHNIRVSEGSIHVDGGAIEQFQFGRDAPDVHIFMIKEKIFSDYFTLAVNVRDFPDIRVDIVWICLVSTVLIDHLFLV